MDWTDPYTRKTYPLRWTQELSEELLKVNGHCQHGRSEPRRRRYANGQEAVWLQCLDCGHFLKALPKSTEGAVWASGQIKIEHDAARDAARDAILLRHVKLQELESAERKADYQAYLRSTAWRERRSLVLDRAAGRCEGCRLAPAIEVHHLTYAHVGEEFLFELVALCGECHGRVHDR